MLVHNWREVLKRAWSVRLMALALLIIILEPVYLFVAATWVSHNIYIQLGMSMVTGLLAAAAIVARIFFQQKISGDLNGKPPTEG
ncbi:hypothetical protein E0H39_03260 [Rhizobium leguminosarum bv. viciae]|uniref:Transmembrane protein n=1 Tax=Rhizobium leguminosarum bv. viciae TaxID=387 RepID=A0A7G6RJC4_RHILV|nr:hypothetical protein [Rhizobium leguminosarum]ASS57566.1 hypothetical protein CHR56_25110 [Rhizobium leguminosarum bv. viciae]QND42356.1 hypothetical protein HB770_11205 [Rhizobium leguminosarum bv. viciae]TBY17512.1 hypothetical protein E0H30_26185 [Rhizobium leguminosarum bv. viciae]TBY24599.1 hypothetical protein E0H37_23035 [Rhizobium leguminosarum bv. viciae]TBY66487.1 hypothetical protein E0H39_03260 [Rhizobium leguminosarum bv. viciae]